MRTLRLLLIVIAFSASACTVGIGTRPQIDGEIPLDNLWIREELTFGSDIPDSRTVTEEDWQQFLGEVVTPRFPDGFTVYNTYGQYLMQSGEIVKEKSWTLVILIPALTPEKNRAIEELIIAYKQRFNQESVLRSTSPAKVQFK